MAEESQTNVHFMNVKELIDTAFGDLEGNKVNFKLIQTTLYLIARQLRILERNVEVHIPITVKERAKGGFKVTEVKLHASNKKTLDVKDGGNQLDRQNSKHTTDVTTKKSTLVYTLEVSGLKSMAQTKRSGKSTTSDMSLASSKSAMFDKSELLAISKRSALIDTLEIAGPSKLSTITTASNVPSRSKKSTLVYSVEVSSKKPAKSTDKKKLADADSLEEYVNKREKELRVIHQRADSHEQPDEAPKPMSSMEDVQLGKLLIVERIPEGGKKEDKTIQISVVTQQEFMDLVDIVQDLRSKLDPIGGAFFPENAQLMEDLRKNASLTDAMAALQLSARLEATEKVLARMMAIVTTVVSSTDGTAPGSAPTAATPPTAAAGIRAPEQPAKGATKPGMQLNQADEAEDRVTMAQIQTELTKVTDTMLKKVNDITTETTKVANEACKTAASIEAKLAATENVGPRVASLEELIANYAEQINILDTGLSSQVTNYQEQLTQMQHELEIGLEAMNEALANAQGGDTVAVAELNDNFVSLQVDQENMAFRQKNLQEIQDVLSADLKHVWKQIEMLRDTKSDRDEVTDALRDKAGIKDLNGIVSLEQFDAVRGDLEKRIAASYDKFNNQELIWQKAIDDLIRELGEKADVVQVSGLKDEIAKYLNMLNMRMKIISDVVGEPRAAAVNKKIFREAPCLCCSTPATIDQEEPAKPPALPKAIGRKTPDGEIRDLESKGDGAHKICYPGLPIPHPPHPRSHYCHRYCGGSHTLISTAPPKVPPGTVLSQLTKPDSTKPTVDEKGEHTLVPCLPCQRPLPSKEPKSPRKTTESDHKEESPVADESIHEATSPPATVGSPQHSIHNTVSQHATFEISEDKTETSTQFKTSLKESKSQGKSVIIVSNETTRYT